MNVAFTPIGWSQYLSWSNETASAQQRLNALIEDIRRHPFTGLGKPEPLKNAMRGWWSRRITSEHRLVYQVEGTGDDQRVVIAQCRYHYN